MRKILLTLLFLTFSLSALQPAHAKNFHCNSYPFKSQEARTAFKQLAHNITMRRILEYQAFNWEDRRMRQICKAASEGKQGDFSCMDGRRDWEAIKASVPKELFGRDNLKLRPDMLALQEQRAKQNPREQVFVYCEGLGVLSRKVKG